MDSKKNKKIIVLGTLLIVLLGLSFIIYTVTGANTGDNKIKVKYVKMTSIKTGNGNYTNDGLDYSADNSSSYSADSSYVAGNDSNENNRIVRSFDTLTYNFEYLLSDKNEVEDYDDRTVSIKVDLTPEEAKYVVFEKNGIPGQETYTYNFDGASTYGSEDASISLYVLGAPNGVKISPKFTIKESTDEDEGIILGKATESSINYSYEDYQYKTVAEFLNYMPTVVSSREGTVEFKVLTTEDSQKATYNNQIGRYVTFVVGAKLNSDSASGIKGYTMPTGNISFDMNVIQTGENAPIFIEEWGRLYGQAKVQDINPILVNIPYSTTDSNSKNKQIISPGELSVTSNGGVYRFTINNFNTTYSKPTVGADNNALNSEDNYISSVAITVFSPRTVSDGKNDINVTLSTSNASFTNVSGTNINIADAVATAVNKYYENNDYSLVSGFYDASGNSKLSKETNVNGVVMKNGTGSLSKGSTFIYKTDFNYKKTLSDKGFKEVVKIDNKGLRFIPFEENDYEIELKCGNDNCPISKDDFEVKFVSGSFDSSNYSLADVNSSKLSASDKELAVSQCSNLDLSSYNNDQIQNLYGGPCIKVNTGVESVFDKIYAAKDDNGKEIPLTKAIVQTKEGVSLPDDISITIKFKLRVRNVTDITHAYQASVVVSTSDYDNELIYYGPRVVENEDSVCNPDNYIKTVYNGSSIISGDNSLFGDSIKVVNFTSREEITVENKNSDGSMKTNYNVIDNDTITYKVKTIIEDNNEAVGADDTWYINNLIINVMIPIDKLDYIPDSDLIKPVSESGAGNYKILTYELPYTKPNMTIPEIRFRAKINPSLITSEGAVPITVKSEVRAKNINGEYDNSLFSLLADDFTIYATSLNTVLVSQEVGSNGTVVEKNEQINYVLKAYNNTNEDVTDYNIVDILPYTGDENGSNVSGNYSAKITMPDSLSQAKVYCSYEKPSTIKKEVYNDKNKWEECDITEDFVDGVTAIRIEKISINRASYMGNILLTLKPKGNKYSNVYANNFIGQSKKHIESASNVIKVKVVSRKISGKVFIDVLGDGVKDKDELYLEGIPVTLYSLGENNSVTKVSETTTNKDGFYEFKDLDKGRYKVRLSYDKNKYDLTLRYATEDTDKDSDAYKVSEGEAEISNKRVPDDPNGIRLTKDVTSATNMDMGLISKQSFGFEMKKYITRIDLAYNNSVNTTNYDNQSKVSITVRNSLNATAKVYYGIAITNNSTKAGYINLVQEDIPKGMIFDNSYPENKDWFEVNGILRTTSLNDVLIKPGETKYLQISLFMPQREEAGTFLNTVSVLESTMYDPEEIVADNEYKNSDTFAIGDALTYAGVDWHVIGVSNNEDNSQNITLLADSGTITNSMGHTTSSNLTYRWSESPIRNYINNQWITNLNLSTLYDNIICDDASGLPNGSYGGTMNSACISQMYDNIKVRLLTLDEYTYLTTASGLSDLSWLYGNNDFWLQNTDYITPEYLQRYINAYNNSFKNKEHTETYNNVNYGIQQNSVHNKAMYIGRSNDSYINLTDTASNLKEVRPVITISTNNIVAE